MPTRVWNRDQTFLIPPSLDDWIPGDHPVRFVADLLDSWDGATWETLGIARRSPERGAPRYAPDLLLGLWIYGFMVGIRSSRGLERAGREQLPFRWLSGNQTPDHNTLHRFYQGHRATRRTVFLQTVTIAARSGMVDWAVQAVDGTKIVANASVTQSRTADQFARLMEQTHEAVDAVEDQQTGTDDDGPPAMPPALHDARTRRDRLAALHQELKTASAGTKRNLTDPDAMLMKTRQGTVPAYNAQAVVSAVPMAPGEPGGRLIVATTVTTAANDQGQLAPMIAEAAVVTGQPACWTVADKGYFSAATIQTCAEQGRPIVVPEPAKPPRPRAEDARFSRQQFAYDASTDHFTCPAGNHLHFRGRHRQDATRFVRRYQAARADCQTCPLAATCVSTPGTARLLRVSDAVAAVISHREVMATEQAQATSRRRGRLIEPVFGTLKDRLGVRRFLRRGLINVQSEWVLTVAAFNLRTLVRRWSGDRQLLKVIA